MRKVFNCIFVLSLCTAIAQAGQSSIDIHKESENITIEKEFISQGAPLQLAMCDVYSVTACVQEQMACISSCNDARTLASCRYSCDAKARACKAASGCR